MSLSKEIQHNNTDCSPINNLYCNIKIRLINTLNQKEIKKLYNCSLCNNCHLAGSNKSVRVRAVSQNLINSHVAEIRENINLYGNSYGIKTSKPEETEKQQEVILFRGCTPNYRTPEILDAAENLLKRNKIEYHPNNNETCCGNILFNLGDTKSGFKAVDENIKKFKELGVKKIITICPGCYNAFNKYYKGRNGFNPEIILAIDLLEESTYSGHDFIIQDPCHAKEKNSTVRKILKNSINKNASPCCGAGGGVMAHNRDLANNKAKKVLERYKMEIVTYCPFCYLNLSSVNPEQTIDIYMLLNNQIN